MNLCLVEYLSTSLWKAPFGRLVQKNTLFSTVCNHNSFVDLISSQRPHLFCSLWINCYGQTTCSQKVQLWSFYKVLFIGSGAKQNKYSQCIFSQHLIAMSQVFVVNNQHALGGRCVEALCVFLRYSLYPPERQCSRFFNLIVIIQGFITSKVPWFQPKNILSRSRPNLSTCPVFPLWYFLAHICDGWCC